MPDRLIEALKSRDMAAVRAAVKADPDAARHPRAIGEAAGAAFLPAIELLHAAGADLNGMWRNYRPLHNVLQGHAHESAKEPSEARLKALDWLLEHGADPEQLGAWPSARALIIAAYMGQPEYVRRLNKAGARVDGFTGAALGVRSAVEKALRDRPGFVLERDGDRLTALQCAAGSRLEDAETLLIATLLIDRGADVRALTKSWNREVNAAYFAARRGGKAMFELLLDRGADATDALSHAVWGGHFELAEIAMAHGGDLHRATADGRPLLNDLIRWGQIPQTMWMLEHRADPNIADAVNGWTAVHQAASRGNVKMLTAVIEAGGDRKRRDRKGNLPRDVATRENIAEMLKR